MKSIIKFTLILMALLWTALLTWVLIDCSIEIFRVWPEQQTIPTSVKVLMVLILHVVMIAIWTIFGLLFPASFINALVSKRKS